MHTQPVVADQLNRGSEGQTRNEQLLQRIPKFLREMSSASHPQFLVALYGEMLRWPFNEANYNRHLTELFSGVSREQLIESLVLGRPASKGPRAQRRQPRTSPEDLVKGYNGLEQYQDIWVKGKLLRRGLRECEDRFEMLRDFCTQFKRPFTILDIGSNLGYFSLRLTETFECTSLACEGVYGDWIEDVLHSNGNQRVILVRKVMSLRDLRALAEVEHFDVVLALSVIHHLDGGFDESLEVLRSLGEHLILELPVEPNACGQSVVTEALNFKLPEDAVLMGYGQSHLANTLRPILRLSRRKTRITKAYLGTPRRDLSLTIQSDFESKGVEFHNKREERPWVRGVNLQTYLWFNGAYPPKEDLAGMVKATGCPGRPHRDIQPWNIVLQGDGVAIIDADDPNHVQTYDDESHLRRLVRLLEADAEGRPIDPRGSKTSAIAGGAITPGSNSKPVIAIDARTFDMPESVARGIGHYTLNHLLELGRLRPDWNFVLLNSEGTANLALEPLLKLENFRVCSIKESGTIKPCVYHIPDPLTLPYGVTSPMQLFPGAPCTAVFYDLTPLKFYAAEFARLDLTIYRQRLNELLQRNIDLLAISEFTRKDLLETTGIGADRVTAVLAGLNRCVEAKAPIEDGAAIRRKYGITGPYFLHVGALDPHKNFQSVLNAFLRLPAGFAQLVVVGMKTGPLKTIAEQCARLNQPGVLFPGFVPRDELELLYQEAAATVTLSRYEGFGLPVLEAMAHGCPVISSNVTSLPEVCGDAAMQFAPGDIAGVADAMVSLVSDPSRRESLSRLGRAQAARFTWEESARRTLAVWDRLVAGRLPEEAELPAVIGGNNVVSAPARVRPGGLVVRWEGAFHDNGSLAHVNRSIAAELENAGVKLLRRESGIAGTDSPGVTIRHSWPPNWTPPATGKLVVMQPWEFGALPKEWAAATARVDQVWVYTEYVRNIYIQAGVPAAKVKVVPCGIDPARFKPEVAPLPLPTRKRFKFLFVGGTIYRKGPDLLLAAYLNAFSGSDDVCLVIKDFGGASCYKGQTLEADIRKAQARPNAPEILYITDELRGEELPRLYAACDCLVHPYRGEGFGLPVLEAMACGLPVIVSQGGATDDFARPDLVYGIQSHRRSIGRNVSGMELAGEGWFLEPSLSQLRERLIEVYQDPATARLRGRAASEYARQEWTWERGARVGLEHLVNLGATGDTLPVGNPVHDSLCRIGSLESARGFFASGRLQEAWGSAVKAVEARPFHPEGFMLLGEIAAKAGDITAARECLLSASRLVPHWKAPKKALKRLHGRKGASRNPLPGLPLLSEKPRISVCLITRDEEKFLGRCLASVKEFAFQIIVVDTGSTDRTVEIAREHGAEVHHFTWCDDFAAARNASIEHARGDWILVLDADEELPRAQHEVLLKEIANPKVIAYRLPMEHHGHEEHRTIIPRLFRNAPGAHFQCRVHEQAFPSLMPLANLLDLEVAIASTKLLHYGYTKELMVSRAKVERNLRLLQTAVREHPEDVNVAMNLALEMCRSGDEFAGLNQYRDAFRLLSAKAATTSPELREMFLDQFISALNGQGRKEEVLEVFESELARKHGLSATLHFSAGLAFMNASRVKEAAEQFRSCLARRNDPALSRINPEIHSAAPNHCLARCLANLGDRDGAEKAFREALQGQGKTESIKTDFAAFLAETDRHVDALTLLYEVVRENSGNLQAWKLGARIASSRREFLEFAVDWTQEALIAFPDNAELAVTRAWVLLIEQSADRALQVLRQIAVEDHSLMAARLMCQLAAGEPLSRISAGEAAAVGYEFIQLYRRLLDLGAVAQVTCLNERVGLLEAVLPAAARMLRAALEEARVDAAAA